MSLTHLTITNLRNIESASIEPGAGLNFIFGANGSGKTSILEAIYLLSRGRSFRSAYSRKIVRYGQESLTVFGRAESIGSPAINLGVQIKDGQFRAKVAGNYLKKSSDLAALLPLLLITPDADKLVKGSPRQRRRFLDWGLFHVEHSFLDVFQRYNRILSQRNAILRQGQRKMLTHWDTQLLDVAEQLDELRNCYVAELGPIAKHFLTLLMGMGDVGFKYLHGWPANEDYATALGSNIHSDLKAGYTQRGPHRSDLQIRVDNQQAAQHLSGGQQKLVACALMLAQVKLFSERSQQRCIILVDDLPSELDKTHRKTFLDLLYSIGGQSFITATDPALLDLSGYENVKVFHVEHGLLSQK